MKNNEKKPSRLKYIIPAVIVLLCILTGYIYKVITWEPKPDPESEKMIRQIIAANLHKDPNELTDDDFLQIKTLQIYEYNSKMVSITNAQLSDIKLLEKCKNLEMLSLYANLPLNTFPKWMKVMDKYGIINIKNKYSIDLSPLKKLPYLQELMISDIPVSIKELTNLRKLTIMRYPVSNLKPIEGLVNLETLKIYNLQTTDLNPIKKLTNLKLLETGNCLNLTDEHVEDLQKALPELKIVR